MNIAYYSHYFTPEIGAPSARLYDLSKQWLQQGHLPQVITCFPNHPVGRIYPGYAPKMYGCENLDGIKVHRHWTYITPNRGFLKKILGHISYLPSALVLSNRRMDFPQVAIGSSPTFFAAMAAAGTGMQFHIPFIMEIRDLWPAIFIDLGVLRSMMIIKVLERLELVLYRKATKIVTVTEAFRQNLIDRGIPSEKVHTIPNGADVDYWKPDGNVDALKRDLGMDGCFVLLYIGAHGISHALGKILDAAAQLKHQQDIRFVFVGEGAEKVELLRKADALRLGNISFHEPVDKNGVKRFYSIADACFVPLRNIPLFDTFIPSKMFEIMAMERPIIGSVHGESADILKRSKSAVVVEPENSDAIAEAILFLYRNRKSSRHMGKEGRRFVVSHYSRGALASNYMEVIQQAVEAHHRVGMN